MFLTYRENFAKLKNSAICIYHILFKNYYGVAGFSLFLSHWIFFSYLDWAATYSLGMYPLPPGNSTYYIPSDLQNFCKMHKCIWEGELLILLIIYYNSHAAQLPATLDSSYQFLLLKLQLLISKLKWHKSRSINRNNFLPQDLNILTWVHCFLKTSFWANYKIKHYDPSQKFVGIYTISNMTRFQEGC